MSELDQIGEQEIFSIVSTLWSTVLGLEVRAADGREDGPDTAPHLMARIRITGTLRASVHLVCPVPLARRAASKMYALEPSAAGMRELRDALGELANHVAGSIKTLLPEGCLLSLPTATDGFPAVREGVYFIRTRLQCEGMTLQVFLIDDTPNARHESGETSAVTRGEPGVQQVATGAGRELQQGGQCAPPAVAAQHELEGTTVLVIDDDPLIRDLMRLMLEGDGCTVFEAGDGDEGVAMFKNTLCDVVITDILMPGKEGVATCIEIKMMAPRTQVIVMSGADSASVYFSVAEKLGAVHSLHKPFSRDELLLAVRHAMLDRPGDLSDQPPEPRPAG